MVAVQFDEIDLSKTPNRTLSVIDFMEFERFSVINTTAMNAKGWLADDDLGVAVTAPNAIVSVPNEFGGPSIFKSNATALHAFNVSEYFDFISFAVTPLGPVTDFIYLDINAWTIEGKTPINFQSLGIGWDGEDMDYMQPWIIEPREYFEGWGEKVNWIEIKGGNEYEEPWQFALDNVVLEFHKRNETDSD